MRITRSLEIPDTEVELRFSRSSGPGGQNINKRSTKVEAIFDVAGSPLLSEPYRTRLLRKLRTRLDGEGRIHVVAQDGRTQTANREHALERLQTILAHALAPPPKPRVPTKPSRRATDRRIETKRSRSRTKTLRAKPPREE